MYFFFTSSLIDHQQSPFSRLPYFEDIFNIGIYIDHIQQKPQQNKHKHYEGK